MCGFQGIFGCVVHTDFTFMILFLEVLVLRVVLLLVGF